MSLVKTYKQLVASLVVLVFLTHCKSPEPNPCLNAQPTTAAFNMGIYFKGGSGEWAIDTLIDSDTLLYKKFITFVAEDSLMDSYEWHIGNDPRVFTEQSVTLFFDYTEDSLKVELIAKKQPKTNCFPNDVGIDTLVRYLTIIDQKDNPIIGKYTGYLASDPTTEMEVEVIFDRDLYGYQINNINKGCFPVENYQSGIDVIEHVSTYKAIYFAENLHPGDYAYPNACMDPRGWAVLDSDNKTITISFSQGAREKEPPYAVLPEERTYDVYHGSKTN